MQAEVWKDECQNFYKPFPKKVKGPLKWLKTTSKCNGFFVNIPKLCRKAKGIPPGWKETKSGNFENICDTINKVPFLY